jgi:molecular chaperone GrpE
VPQSDQPTPAEAPARPDESTRQAQTDEEAASEATETAPEAADVVALRQELAEVTKQSEYHLDQWRRSAANLENFRKHVEKERADVIKSAKGNVIAQLLPVLDDLERAFDTIPFELSNFTWTDGLALIDRKLQMVLERQGLQEIKALGVPFDPAHHQALLEEETEEHPDGHVMAILQKGYKLDDRILRPALVKIARNTTTGKESGGVDHKEQAEEQGTGEGADCAAEDSSELN